MAYLAYAIIWIAVLFFSGYMTLKTGNYNFLWFIALPAMMRVGDRDKK